MFCITWQTICVLKKLLCNFTQCSILSDRNPSFWHLLLWYFLQCICLSDLQLWSWHRPPWHLIQCTVLEDSHLDLSEYVALCSLYRWRSVISAQSSFMQTPSWYFQQCSTLSDSHLAYHCSSIPSFVQIFVAVWFRHHTYISYPHRVLWVV